MSDVASEEVKESSSPIENKPSSSRREESREETFALTGVDGVDEEVNDMHHYDTESVQEMVKHAVEEVEHHLEDEDAMLAERLSEAKKMASMARNENDINSASSSRRTSFSFDVPKFVEDNEDNLDGIEKLDLESIAETEYDLEPESMSPSRRDRAPPLKERYFGAEARMLFYDRLRFLYKQRYNTVYDESHEMEELIFDNEDESKLDYPFSPLADRKNIFDQNKKNT